MRVVAMGGMSGRGFIFGEHIAALGRITRELEGSLAACRRLDAELTQATTHAALGSKEAIDGLRARSRAPWPTPSGMRAISPGSHQPLTHRGDAAAMKRLTLLFLALAVLVPAAAAAADLVEGTDERDVLRGTNGYDRMYGHAKDDTISAFDGNDIIDGGTGDDVIRAGGGNDVITAQSGKDVVNAGSGNDRIDTGTGGDRILAGGGRDVIDSGKDDDVIRARDGRRDRISCGTGTPDTVYADRADRVARSCERVRYR
jgi:Ca2+-binding RTX toxin-like protein